MSIARGLPPTGPDSPDVRDGCGRPRRPLDLTIRVGGCAFDPQEAWSGVPNSGEPGSRGLAPADPDVRRRTAWIRCYRRGTRTGRVLPRPVPTAAGADHRPH